jgi:hypothetical protein
MTEMLLGKVLLVELIKPVIIDSIKDQAYALFVARLHTAFVRCVGAFNSTGLISNPSIPTSRCVDSSRWHR